MKNTLLFLILCIANVVTAQNTWTQKMDFPNDTRELASAFTIGTKAYFGLGYHNYGLKDLWEWNQAKDTWTLLADFAGRKRGGAVGFSIGSKGYIGLGEDSLKLLRDFWEYDPISAVWTRKADFGGVLPGSTVGFSIGSKGYVLGDSNDLWEFDPAVNTWTRKANYPTCHPQIAFSIGGKGYFGLGKKTSSIYCTDFWEYDPATNTWVQKADYPGGKGYGRYCFSIGNQGYVGEGQGPQNAFNTGFWQYDPLTNSWLKRADFASTGRSSSTGFSIGTKGYIVCGQDNISFLLRELWEYGAVGNGIHKIDNENNITVYPNPFSRETTIKISEPYINATLIIYNTVGQEVMKLNNLQIKEITLSREKLTNGIYILRLVSQDYTFITSKKIIITD